MGRKMIVGIQGTSSFNDYQVFLRAMAVTMSSLKEEDPYFYIYSAGPANFANKKKNQNCSKLVDEAKNNNVEYGIFRY